MRRSIPTLLLPLALLGAAATSAPAQGAAPNAAAANDAAPAVGAPAPNFTAPWADASGPGAAPLSLADYRGQVVVLAFYPKDRSTGCTAELHKFRDEYDTLFGDGVVVLPISVDDADSHASWARDDSFPFRMVADTELTVAELYGSRAEGRPVASRTVFVIAPDGKVAWRDMRFNALSEKAYTALAEAVASARASHE